MCELRQLSLRSDYRYPTARSAGFAHTRFDNTKMVVNPAATESAPDC